MGKHHKLSSQERDQIAWWTACGVPGREIARRLGRSPSTISDELKRNRSDGVYGAISANRAAEARKRNSHKKYLLRSHPGLSAYVLDQLTWGWSPQGQRMRNRGLS